MNTNKLVRYNAYNPSLFTSMDEFLTPFTSLYNEVFNSSFPDLFANFGIDFYGKNSYPKVDIQDNETSTLIEAEIPGLSKDQVSVEIKDDILTIKGEKQDKKDYSTGSQCIHKELKKSSFSRSFSLNSNYDKESVAAKFNNGILEITLKKLKPTPKKEESRKVEIK